jgi:hypothetical protein
MDNQTSLIHCLQHCEDIAIKSVKIILKNVKFQDTMH